MVEGRISAGVVVGDGSDVGGGASIMGTLSGGGTAGRLHRRALPARRQRRHRHRPRRRLRRRGRALRHRGHQGHLCPRTAGSSRRRAVGRLGAAVPAQLGDRRRRGRARAAAGGSSSTRRCTPTPEPPHPDRVTSATPTRRLPTAAGAQRRRRRPVLVAVLVLVRARRGRLGVVARIDRHDGPPAPLHRQRTRALHGASSPEQAGNAAIIAAVAVRRDLPARAATIAVATALQESKLATSTAATGTPSGCSSSGRRQGWGTAAADPGPGLRDQRASTTPSSRWRATRPCRSPRSPQGCSARAFPAAYADHEHGGAASSLRPHGLLPCRSLVRAGSHPAPPAPGPPDADGLTPRARAVASAAAHETGRAVTRRLAARPRRARRAAWAVRADAGHARGRSLGPDRSGAAARDQDGSTWQRRTDGRRRDRGRPPTGPGRRLTDRQRRGRRRASSSGRPHAG